MYNWTNKDEWGWMVLFAVGSAIFSKIIQFIYGNFLYNDYKLQETRWNTLDKKIELDCYLNIQDQDYYFYFLCFITIVAGWWANILCMYGHPNSLQTKWLVGTFVSMGFDWLVLEILFVLLGSGEGGVGSNECCRRRGIYFDFSIYEKFYYKKLR